MIFFFFFVQEVPLSQPQYMLRVYGAMQGENPFVHIENTQKIFTQLLINSSAITNNMQ